MELLFWYEFQFTPCWHKQPTGSSAALACCHARSTSFSLCSLRVFLVDALIDSKTLSCTPSCTSSWPKHLDMSRFALVTMSSKIRKVMIPFNISEVHKPWFLYIWRCINFKQACMPLCIFSQQTECGFASAPTYMSIIHAAAYNLAMRLLNRTRSDAFSRHVWGCFAHSRFTLVRSQPWFLLFINHNL